MIRLILLLISVTLTLFFILSFQDNESSHDIVPRGSFMENVHISHIKNNGLVWEATARKVIINPQIDNADFLDIKFTFAEHGLSASSEIGTYNLKSDNLSINTPVTAHKDGIDIHTDSLQWSSNEKSLESDSHVVISSESFRVEGDGMNITENGTVILRENVVAVVF